LTELYYNVAGEERYLEDFCTCMYVALDLIVIDIRLTDRLL